MIEKHGGRIDNFIGDAVIVVFDKASDALRYTIEARFAERQLKDELAKMDAFKGHEELAKKFSTGMGIATGEVLQANVGNTSRMKDTYMGDVVNLSARLEGLTKKYRAPLLIDETTYQDIQAECGGLINVEDYPGAVFLRMVDKVLPKGRKTPSVIYECFNSAADLIKKLKMKTLQEFPIETPESTYGEPTHCPGFQTALDIYLTPAQEYPDQKAWVQDLQRALGIFEAINNYFLSQLPQEMALTDPESGEHVVGDNISYLMKLRLQRMIANPEDYHHWNGVYAHHEK